MKEKKQPKLMPLAKKQPEPEPFVPYTLLFTLDSRKPHRLTVKRLKGPRPKQ